MCHPAITCPFFTRKAYRARPQTPKPKVYEQIRNRIPALLSSAARELRRARAVCLCQEATPHYSRGHSTEMLGAELSGAELRLLMLDMKKFVVHFATPHSRTKIIPHLFILAQKNFRASISSHEASLQRFRKTL